MHQADPTPFLNLVRQHTSRLVLYARQRCANPEDVVQDAFLQLLRQSCPPDDPVGWLYRVVRNLAINSNRSRRRRVDRETRSAISDQWFTPDPNEHVNSQDAIAALERLDQDLRETIVLRIWCDHSFAQIGELTGTSAATANRRFHAGLDQLRTQLDAEPPSKTNSQQNSPTNTNASS